jgi:hypothetical protein
MEFISLHLAETVVKGGSTGGEDSTGNVPGNPS